MLQTHLNIFVFTALLQLHNIVSIIEDNFHLEYQKTLQMKSVGLIVLL